MTTTSFAPGLLEAGIVKTIVVEEDTVYEAVIESTFTEVAPEKFVPVIVSK